MDEGKGTAAGRILKDLGVEHGALLQELKAVIGAMSVFHLGF